MFSFMARQTDLRMPNGDIKGWIPIPKQAAALRMEACEEVHQSIENPRLLQQSSWGTTLSFSTFSQIKLCDKSVTKRLILCLKCFDPTFKIQEGKKLAASRRALCIFFLPPWPYLLEGLALEQNETFFTHCVKTISWIFKDLFDVRCTIFFGIFPRKSQKM